jgi:hypothetical protein
MLMLARQRVRTTGEHQDRVELVGMALPSIIFIRDLPDLDLFIGEARFFSLSWPLI